MVIILFPHPFLTSGGSRALDWIPVTGAGDVHVLPAAPSLSSSKQCLSDRKERNSKEHPPYKELFCQHTYYLVFRPHCGLPNDSVKVQCLCLDSWLNTHSSQGLDLAHVGL